MIERTERDVLISDISDTFKSVNGFRPRWNWDAWSIEDLRAELKDLLADLAREMAEERAAKQREEDAKKPSPRWTIGDLASIENDPRMYPSEVEA